VASNHAARVIREFLNIVLYLFRIKVEKLKKLLKKEKVKERNQVLAGVFAEVLAGVFAGSQLLLICPLSSCMKG
jgi:hypothetical protein